MPNCTCGAHISDDFKRVFADNDGIVHACPTCAANAASKHPEKAGEKATVGVQL